MSRVILIAFFCLEFFLFSREKMERSRSHKFLPIAGDFVKEFIHFWNVDIILEYGWIRPVFADFFIEEVSE